MPLNFLTPRVERISSDGVFESVHPGGVLGRLRRPVLLLARDLCAYSLFEGGALPSGRRRQAARLHARLASPYVVGGAALIKAGPDFGIWWWDLERISPALEARFGAARPSLRPETLAQPLGRGWRIVALRNGYEAQLWRGKALVASAWRRARFDAASWAAFNRMQRGAEAAPDEPPAPSQLPIAFDSEAFALSRGEVSREQAIGMAAGGFALVAASAVALLLGQGLHLQAEARDIEAETAEIRLATPRAGAVAALEADRRTLAAYREVEERTNPLSATGAAVGIAAFYDLTPTSLEATADALTMTLPYGAIRVIDDLVAEFEGSGYFFDIQPRTDTVNDSLILEMKTRPAAPPLTADG